MTLRLTAKGRFQSLRLSCCPNETYGYIWHCALGRHDCRLTTVSGRVRLKRDGTRAETRFRLSPKRTSSFKPAGASVQSTAGSRGVRISGSNAGYTTFRGCVRVLATHSIRHFPLHFPSHASPRAIRFQTHSTNETQRDIRVRAHGREFRLGEPFSSATRQIFTLAEGWPRRPKCKPRATGASRPVEATAIRWPSRPNESCSALT